MRARPPRNVARPTTDGAPPVVGEGVLGSRIGVRVDHAGEDSAAVGDRDGSRDAVSLG
jgi:hypothetical protein